MRWLRNLFLFFCFKEKWIKFKYFVTKIGICRFQGLQAGWLKEYSYKCQPVDYSQNGIRVSLATECKCEMWWKIIVKFLVNSHQMARAVWLYYMAKVIELLDTVFFVLRKRTRQVTFLHLYHHTMMPICSFVGVKYMAGESTTKRRNFEITNTSTRSDL